MRDKFLSLAFAVVVIGASLWVRGALLPKVHYGEAQAAMPLSAEVSPHVQQVVAPQLKKISSGNVLNLSADEVLVLLQEPEFTRTEASIQMWQYRTKGCVLDLYFDPAGQVVHYDMRARDRAVAAAQVQGSCVSDVIAQASDQRYIMAQN